MNKPTAKGPDVWAGWAPAAADVLENRIRQIVRQELAANQCDHLIGTSDGPNGTLTARCVKCGSTGPFTHAPASPS